MHRYETYEIYPIGHTRKGYIATGYTVDANGRQMTIMTESHEFTEEDAIVSILTTSIVMGGAILFIRFITGG